MRMLPIARPCTESFAAMPGDDKTRFCDKCQKHVHDLSARTEEEARALFREARGGRTCVRFAKDASGNVLFRAAALAAAVSVTSCSSAAPTTTPPITPAAVDHDMGDGVPDSVDLCPEHPGPNDDDGCESASDAGHDGA
jgi:hypothetical protein